MTDVMPVPAQGIEQPAVSPACAEPSAPPAQAIEHALTAAEFPRPGDVDIIGVCLNPRELTEKEPYFKSIFVCEGPGVSEISLERFAEMIAGNPKLVAIATEAETVRCVVAKRLAARQEHPLSTEACEPILRRIFDVFMLDRQLRSADVEPGASGSLAESVMRWTPELERVVVHRKTAIGIKEPELRNHATTPYIIAAILYSLGRRMNEFASELLDRFSAHSQALISPETGWFGTEIVEKHFRANGRPSNSLVVPVNMRAHWTEMWVTIEKAKALHAQLLSMMPYADPDVVARDGWVKIRGARFALGLVPPFGAPPFPTQPPADMGAWPEHDSGMFQINEAASMAYTTRSPFLRLLKKRRDVRRLTSFSVPQNATGYALGTTGFPLSVPNTTSLTPYLPLEMRPRDGTFGAVISAGPANPLILTDLREARLSLLAAHLEQRYGRSVLADLLRERDLCSAAPGASEPESAGDGLVRAIMVAIASGIGPLVTADFVRDEYGIEVDAAQAADLHGQILQDIYPELGAYFADDIVDVLARNLNWPPADLRERLAAEGMAPEAEARRLQAALSVRLVSAKTKAQKSERDRAIRLIQEWNRAPWFVEMLKDRATAHRWAAHFFNRFVISLGGRIRSSVSDGEAWFAPVYETLLNLAKLATIQLVRAGFGRSFFSSSELVVVADTDEPEKVRDDVRQIHALIGGVIRKLTRGIPARLAVSVGPHLAAMETVLVGR